MINVGLQKLILDSVYVKNEINFSDTDKQQIENSNTAVILKDPKNTNIQTNKNKLISALQSLNSYISSEIDNVKNQRSSNELTQKVLNNRISYYSTGIIDNVVIVNQILPSEILLQDFDLSNYIPILTNESSKLITEIYELNYRLEQLSNMLKNQDLKISGLEDLHKKIDEFILILES